MINAVPWPMAAGEQREADFEFIVREHQQRVFRVLLGMLRDRDAAETLTQECFLKAYQGREEFRGEAQVGTWLLRIAINLGRDYLRNRRLMFWRRVTRQGQDASELADQLPGDSAPADRTLIARERLEQIWASVERLSPRQRAIFLLKFVEEMDYDEIAAALDLKAATVRVHLLRALQAVQKAVQE